MNEAFEKWLLMNARYYSGKKAVAQGAFEAGRKQAAERCAEIAELQVIDDGPYIYEGAIADIRKEFGL